MPGASIGFNFKVSSSFGKIFKEILETYVEQAENMSSFFRNYIIPDIYLQNEYMFQSGGINKEGDGVLWPENGRWWKGYKEKYEGQTVKNPFYRGNDGDNNAFFKEITIESSQVCMLTKRLYNALTGRSGEFQPVVNPQGFSLTCNIPYLKQLQMGHEFLSSTNKKGETSTRATDARKVIFIGPKQREKYREWAKEWLENKSIG